MPAVDWSELEVQLVVASYREMFLEELAGRSINKTAHRALLAPMLNGRSRGSIEFKHQNISAVLRDNGHPWIDGYKPRSNYQRLLSDVVIDMITTDPAIQAQLVLAVGMEPGRLVVPEDQMLDRLVAKPESDRPQELYHPQLKDSATKPNIKAGVDWLAIEAANRKLGFRGEEFVLEFEKARLRSAGEERLAEQVEHVSQSRGDGLGYDILSFDADSRERLIEVKTTSFGKRTPFFASSNEVRVSQREQDRYQLYRVFEFTRKAQLFALPGGLMETCYLAPTTFAAKVR